MRVASFGSSLLELLKNTFYKQNQETEPDQDKVVEKNDNFEWMTGYLLETHYVDTEDGYILCLIRIRRNRNDKLNDKEESLKKPVLLVHGFLSSGVTWFRNNQRQCLPCKLSDEGYDVWIGNLRGTPLSRGHRFLDNDSREYWDFSWHEMGRWDIPKIISYILSPQITNGGHCNALHFIAHSMACSAFFASLSLHPELNDKIASMIALAPAIYAAKVRNKSIKYILAPILNSMSSFKVFHQQGIFSSRGLFSSLALALIPSTSQSMSERIFSPGPGTPLELSDISNLEAYLPQSTSVKVLCHGMQCIRGLNFQEYDYGVKENLKRYSQENPPSYDIKMAKCSIATFYADDDEVCTKDDVTALANDLENLIDNFGINENGFRHVDFTCGLKAPRLVFEPILKILQKFDLHL